MARWADRRDVYGRSAADVPALLQQAALTADWDAPVWGELWTRLYHQGGVAPASYAALPALALIAAARPQIAVEPAIVIAASIIASTDGPTGHDDVRQVYAAQIRLLRPIAEHKLELVHEHVDVVYALQAVAAFEDLSNWQRDLEYLANEEIELECPSCTDHLYLELVDGTLVVTTDPDVVDGARSLLPAQRGELAVAEARLVELARTYRQLTVEAELLQLFGRACCPNCGTHFAVQEAFA